MGHCKFNLSHTLWQESKGGKYSLYVLMEIFSVYLGAALFDQGWLQISSGTLGPGLTNTWTDSGDKRGKYSLPFGQIYFPFGQIMFVQIKNIWSRLVQISLVRLTNTRIHSGDQRDNYNLPFGQLHLACGKIHFVQMAKCIWSRFPWSVWAILGQTVGQKRQEGGRTAQLRPKEGIDIRMRIFCLLMVKIRQQR